MIRNLTMPRIGIPIPLFWVKALAARNFAARRRSRAQSGACQMEQPAEIGRGGRGRQTQKTCQGKSLARHAQASEAGLCGLFIEKAALERTAERQQPRSEQGNAGWFGYGRRRCRRWNVAAIRPRESLIKGRCAATCVSSRFA